MSRVGNRSIYIPAEVSLSFNGDWVKVQGVLGSLEKEFKQKVIQFEVVDNYCFVKTSYKDKFSKSLHGLYRALLSNMIQGVQNFFQKKLILNGVGFKVQKKEDNMLQFALAFSHPIFYQIPNNVNATIADNGTLLILESSDKELLGEVAAKIRAFKPPEPYKKKGIRYFDEIVMMKAGKTSKK